jgi:hypothetical protein
VGAGVWDRLQLCKGDGEGDEKHMPPEYCC